MPFDRYPEITALAQYRLEHDLSYRQLATATGIPFKSLHELLTKRSPRPYDRTLYKIRKFLETPRPAPPRIRARTRRTRREVTM